MKTLAKRDGNEYVITSLKLQGAKVNVWGVGTKLITAYDDPALSGAFVCGVWGCSDMWSSSCLLDRLSFG